MKKKLLGIFVCMLLIATMAIPISALNDFNKSNTLDVANVPKTTSTDADVPVWETGDSWTYEIEMTSRTDPNETMKYTLSGDLVFTVVDDTGDHYTLEGIGESISIVGNIGKLGLKSSRIITFNTDLVVRKSDLGVSSYYYMFKGIAFITLGIIIIPFPIQVQVYRNSEFTPERPLLPFPLFDGKNGTFNSVTLKEDWATTMFWGLITADEGNGSGHTVTSDYICTAEQITVPAGTYEVYNVTTYEHGNYARLYYNTTVGNTVKFSNKQVHDEWHDWWLIQEFKLKSTTYTP
ncbi:MAG: hypothetical protein KAU84_00130 [Thermoplasmatales archaeon]|nr:hypothetical protein [Thermoplasmatales archaeon]